MTLRLLDLPVEILNRLLEELLPSTCSVMGGSGPPMDLCRLMLVCKALSCLAFPWVWRKARINYPGTTSPQARRPPAQSLCLLNRVEAATHIRILIITIAERNQDNLQRAFTALRPAILLMDNIRVLKFICPGAPKFGHNVLDEVYHALISKPQLHTLITNHYLPPDLQPHSFHSLTRLYAFGDESMEFSVFIQRVSPRLESLVIHYCRGGPLALSLPWAALREIELIDVEKWPLILDNFLLWKENFPNTPSLLAEISIDGPVSHDDLVRLILGFKSQIITNFRVRRVNSINGALLDVIADSFPGLQNLGLMEGNYLGEWHADLSTVSKFLGKLPRLKSLLWNNVGVWTSSDHGTSKDTPREFRSMLPIVGKASRTLETIMFYHQFRPFSYVITRDDMDEYSGYVEDYGHSNCDPWTTSSWNTCHYSRI